MRYIASLLIAITLGCSRQVPVASPADLRQLQPIYSSIEAAFAAGDSAKAAAEIEQALVMFPEDRWLICAKAESLQRSGKNAEARRLLGTITGTDELAQASLIRLVEIDIKLGNLYQAIDRLAAAIQEFPNRPRIPELLGIYLYGVGQTWEAQQHFDILLRRKLPPPNILKLMLDRSRAIDFDEKSVAIALERNPQDLRPLLLSARRAAREGRWLQATEICEEILKIHPRFVSAYILLGHALIQHRPDRFPQWAGAAFDECEQHPDFWLAQGLFAEQNAQYAVATRCFIEAIRLDPSFREAHQHLAPTLTALGRTQDAAVISNRLNALTEVTLAADNLLDRYPNSQQAMLELAQALERVGNLWEAVAWGTLALNLQEDPVAGAPQIVSEMTQRLRGNVPRVGEEFNVATKLDLADLPMPAKAAFTTHSHQTEPNAEAVHQPPPVRLENHAQALGLDFLYHNGDDPQTPGLWLHQSNGGGVAVIDFDQDGWPDLYFSQAGGEPLDLLADSPGQLFRNARGSFQETTERATLKSHGYGQGVASGDYNDDGYPDLLVAGIGTLQLFRNNGDGTFQEVTQESGLVANFAWNTSVAMADLNNDVAIDIYQACYLSDETPFTDACFRKEQPDVPSPCRPTNFPAASDRIFFGDGSGQFRDASQDLLTSVIPGRGLGVLVADLDQKTGLEVFVANDMTANHLLQFTSPPTDHSADSAGIRGLAFDAMGRPQACMGIASADLDDDGDLDLAVTNFTKEANCLYNQIHPGVFRDDASAMGISELSLNLLGFGVQFVDLDNSGDMEMVIANGHVDFQPAHGHAMPMQVLFRSHGAGRWHEIASETLGSFFQSKHVGRALAIADFNRDLKPDLVATLLDEPAALLMNETELAGNSVMLRLIGTRGTRDPVGAQVKVRAAGRDRHFQLTAGHGYMCTNQQVVFCGLGETQKIDSIEIVWPSGIRSKATDLDVNQEHLLIEPQ